MIEIDGPMGQVSCSCLPVLYRNSSFKKVYFIKNSIKEPILGTYITYYS